MKTQLKLAKDFAEKLFRSLFSSDKNTDDSSDSPIPLGIRRAILLSMLLFMSLSVVAVILSICSSAASSQVITASDRLYENPPIISSSSDINVSESDADFVSSGDLCTATTSTAETTSSTSASTSTTATTTSNDRIINHEDVLNPNYKSPYYIIVYTKNCTVRILGKDSDGGYTRSMGNFLCSSGTGNGTPSGLYSIDKRYSFRAMFGDVYAQYAVRFYGNYLFHSVPYYEKTKSTLEMAEYEKLGTQASLGCVRLCVRDAKWIYDNCPNGTQVRVLTNKDGPSHSSTMRIPPLNYDAPYNGWDPTDPDENNPYRNPPEESVTSTEETEATTSTETAVPSETETSASKTAPTSVPTDPPETEPSSLDPADTSE